MRADRHDRAAGADKPVFVSAQPLAKVAGNPLGQGREPRGHGLLSFSQKALPDQHGQQTGRNEKGRYPCPGAFGAVRHGMQGGCLIGLETRPAAPWVY